jgi:uncharacterized membrane protein
MPTAPEGRLPPRRASEGAPGSDTVEELTRRNVERVLAVEAADQQKATTADRVANAITRFSGSITFALINVLLVGGWVILNLRLSKSERIDPFPFELLTLALSVEAILLGIFILMSQNQAERASEKRVQLDLQLTLLSEQENTKMLLMLEQIGHAVGAETIEDADVDVLAQPTQPEAVAEQIDRAADMKKQRPTQGP